MRSTGSMLRSYPRVIAWRAASSASASAANARAEPRKSWRGNWSSAMMRARQSARLPVIHRQNVSVIKDKFRLFLFQREERERGECSEKFAARSSIVHDGPLYDMERMLRMLRRRWANVNVPTRKAEGELASQAAEEFVEFVGGIEVAFEFARAEFFAK